MPHLAGCPCGVSVESVRHAKEQRRYRRSVSLLRLSRDTISLIAVSLVAWLHPWSAATSWIATGSLYRRVHINGELRGRDVTQFCRSFTMARILLVITIVLDNSHNSASTLHVHEAKSIYGTATLCLRSSRRVACSLHPCFCCTRLLIM